MIAYSPGDLFDKYSILLVKHQKGLPVTGELELFRLEVEALVEEHPDAKQVLESLVESNSLQFELENQINKEQDRSKVGSIALDIRRRNNHRVQLKNRIQELCRASFLEIKSY